VRGENFVKKGDLVQLIRTYPQEGFVYSEGQLGRVFQVIGYNVILKLPNGGGRLTIPASYLVVLVPIGNVPYGTPVRLADNAHMMSNPDGKPIPAGSTIKPQEIIGKFVQVPWNGMIEQIDINTLVFE
jgi:hypothetical protein